MFRNQQAHKCDRDACLKFMDLWKKKHETGQWVEIEAADVMASQANISAANDSGIVFANGGKIKIHKWFMFIIDDPLFGYLYNYSCVQM